MGVFQRIFNVNHILWTLRYNWIETETFLAIAIECFQSATKEKMTIVIANEFCARRTIFSRTSHRSGKQTVAGKLSVLKKRRDEKRRWNGICSYRRLENGAWKTQRCQRCADRSGTHSDGTLIVSFFPSHLSCHINEFMFSLMWWLLHTKSVTSNNFQFSIFNFH